MCNVLHYKGVLVIFILMILDRHDINRFLITLISLVLGNAFSSLKLYRNVQLNVHHSKNDQVYITTVMKGRVPFIFITPEEIRVINNLSNNCDVIFQ